MARERKKLRTLGEKIGYMRKNKLNLTQDEFAAKMNVSKDTIQNWEQGWDYPSIDRIVEFAELFDCDFDYLLGQQEQPRKVYAHISEMTGLSAQAAQTLSDYVVERNPATDIVSELLEDKKLLYHIYECSSKDYGFSAKLYNSIPRDSFAPSGVPASYRASDMRKADSMILYNSVCVFVDKLRRKLGLPTSHE